MADSKLTALSEVSAPVLTDIMYYVADPGGTPASDKITLARLGGVWPFVPGGRLTTESGVAVSTSDRTAQGTLYYTPYLHGGIRIYDGTRWKLYSFTEVSLALTATSGKNYDVFIYDNSGTLTLELSAAWTDDTTRATALTTQDGVYVKSGATTRLWLGTIRASGSNVTADSGGGASSQVGGMRYVWNAYNQVPRFLSVIDTTDNWTYATNTWRQWDNASGNKVEYVCGNAATQVQASFNSQVYFAGSNVVASVGIGIDSTSTASGTRVTAFSAGSQITFPITASYIGYPGLGYHYVAPLEIAISGTAQFAGDDATASIQNGFIAAIMG